MDRAARPRSREDGEWVVTCPNAFSRKRVQEHFGELIEAELQRVAGPSRPAGSRYHVAGRRNGQTLEPRKRPAAAPAERNHPAPQRPLSAPGFHLRPFRRGGQQRFCLFGLAFTGLAPRMPASPPCFCTPDTGLGKSHLSQAIGHHVLNQNPDERVYYMTAEDFSNEMVQAYPSRHDRQIQDQIPQPLRCAAAGGCALPERQGAHPDRAGDDPGHALRVRQAHHFLQQLPSPVGDPQAARQAAVAFLLQPDLGHRAAQLPHPRAHPAAESRACWAITLRRSR
ncbi:MAG: DnaA/Hda family protein [Desulfobacterales bacterium]|nr:DnaA/Hda family protein [Desulfobacterales bacterium]